MNDERIESLVISVQPSPETNDHEVRLGTETGSLFDRFGGDEDMLGLDPTELLVEPCPLLPPPQARTTTIGRCSCGVVECGSLEVGITQADGLVRWSSTVQPAATVLFDETQYEAEVRRALSDFSWETPGRTAARFIAERVDREHLASSGLSLEWASSRIRQDTMTISMILSDGPYQLLLSVPWAGESPTEIADLCCALLSADPRNWKSVSWSPGTPGLGPPKLLGGSGERATRPGSDRSTKKL